jgi:hypothetical protein
MSRQSNPYSNHDNRSKSRAPKAPAGYRLVSVLFDRPWIIDDRQFFAANPARSHRVRRVFPDEPTNDGGECKWILVKQVEPGRRTKKLLRHPVADNEYSLRALFDLLEDSDVVYLHEWRELTKKYENSSKA